MQMQSSTSCDQRLYLLCLIVEAQIESRLPQSSSQSTQVSSINDLSFTFKLVTKKNSGFLEGHNNGFFGQILSKFRSFSDTVNSQTAHIITLEKRIKELTSYSKGNTLANKAKAVKKIKTMKD